jgi:hypothetical protein
MRLQKTLYLIMSTDNLIKFYVCVQYILLNILLGATTERKSFVFCCCLKS